MPRTKKESVKQVNGELNKISEIVLRPKFMLLRKKFENHHQFRQYGSNEEARLTYFLNLVQLKFKIKRIYFKSLSFRNIDLNKISSKAMNSLTRLIINSRHFLRTV